MMTLREAKVLKVQIEKKIDSLDPHHDMEEWIAALDQLTIVKDYIYTAEKIDGIAAQYPGHPTREVVKTVVIPVEEPTEPAEEPTEPEPAKFAIVIEAMDERRDGEPTGKTIHHARLESCSYPGIKGSPLGRGKTEYAACTDLIRRIKFESGVDIAADCRISQRLDYRSK